MPSVRCAKRTCATKSEPFTKNKKTRPNNYNISEKIIKIGNRCDNNLQFVVVKRVRRYGSYSLAEYVLVVRRSLWQLQLICLVDRVYGSTKWIPHGTVLADR